MHKPGLTASNLLLPPLTLLHNNNEYPWVGLSQLCFQNYLSYVLLSSARRYIGKYSYHDKFTKPVQLVKQYLKTDLLIYRLCLNNYDIQCIIALVFYDVGNTKDYNKSVDLFWLRKNREGHLKALDITALWLQCT